MPINDGNVDQFTGHENHFISIGEAAGFTANYRNTHPMEIIGGFFGMDAIMAVLNQPGCVGIRYYYARQDDGTPVLVMTGADANMNDLWQGVLIEMSMPCPRYCSGRNPLNSDESDV